MSAKVGLQLVLLAAAAVAGMREVSHTQNRIQTRINTVADDIAKGPTQNTPLGKFNMTVPVYATADGKQYMVDVQLGWDSNTSSAQVARLIIDTGSGDIVVFGAHHCETRGGLIHSGGALPECFDFRNSSSFKANVDGLGRRLNTGCRIRETGHEGALCNQALLIDGYKAEVSCELGWEDAKFAGIPLPPPNQLPPPPPIGVPEGFTIAKRPFVRTDICVVNDTRSDWFKMRYWNNTQGTLGMFYRLCFQGQGEGECHAPYPPILDSIAPELQHTFSLDLNAPAESSWMHFGAPLLGWQGVQWGETQPIPLVGRTSSSSPWTFHSFEVFALSLCRTNILGNLSSHWGAMVDSGASCLSLPKELFEAVEAWVPTLECIQERVDGYDHTEMCPAGDPECAGEYKNLTICYLREGASARDLPVLSFSLAEEGAHLHLPLSSLLVNDRPSGRPRVCLNVGDSIAPYWERSRSLLQDPPRISFGTLALRNLFTTFDMEHAMVGMRNKAIFDEDNVQMCATPVVCVGAQEHYGPLNICIDPPCDLLYFHVLDEESKRCRMGSGFLISAVVTLVAFAVAEVALSEIYDRLARKLANTL
mmetsp:Transcript_5284/g.12705  ORF Transcript_5284/g.12705 Transcript_5284/m.12705 type:complete len:591 (-) Transcript_5284:234-2006(-)